jgi:hypothetical protein
MDLRCYCNYCGYFMEQRETCKFCDGVVEMCFEDEPP